MCVTSVQREIRWSLMEMKTCLKRSPTVIALIDYSIPETSQNIKPLTLASLVTTEKSFKDYPV